MYLKSLTLKGFKSFVSSTTLKFEPGICAIVGPNGSGKSNVLDALSWVMGEQGAKTLRGGKMEDVIFAGTPTRPALGRAEVTLTIDNTDGALPIEYSEVSITRRMFRDGASEYELNGDRVRLMDVQELLSDSGIGREMHVIVGQGRLSEILESRPEERRAFIEEAAGVLKHRRRKEKALRKLSAMQINLDRVTDLTQELHRQLAPLGRQAKAAERAQYIQAKVRDARLRLAADDLLACRLNLTHHDNIQRDLTSQREAAAQQVQGYAALVQQAEDELAHITPQLEASQRQWFELSAFAERIAATVRIAGDRSRHMRAEPAPVFGPDPDRMEEQAAAAAQEEAETEAALAAALAQLKQATRVRSDAETQANTLERQRLAAMESVADRREGLARLAGSVEATRTALDNTEHQSLALVEALHTSRTQISQLQQEITATEARLETLEAAETHLNNRLAQAEVERDHADERCATLRKDEREAEREAAGLRARIEALGLAIGLRDAEEWLHNKAPHIALSGRLVQQLTVKEGWESAIAVALGEAASALTVSNSSRGYKAVDALRTTTVGRAMFLIESGTPQDFRMDTDLPTGGIWALDVVKVPRALQTALTSLLMDVVLVEDLDTANAVVSHDRRLRAVTRDGTARGWGWVTGGSRQTHSDVEVQAAIEAATKAEVKASCQAATIEAALRGAEQEYRDRMQAAALAQSALVESDGAIATVTKDLARLTAALKTAQLRRQEMKDQQHALDSQRSALLDELTVLEERHRLVSEESEDPALFDDTLSAEVATTVAAARTAEIEARLEVRTAEERSSHVRGKAAALRRQASKERDLRARAAQREATRAQAVEIIDAVTEAGGELYTALRQQLELLEGRRKNYHLQQTEITARLKEGRQHHAQAVSDYDALRDSAHQDELLRAQAAERLRLMEEQVRSELGIGCSELIDSFGPQVLLPVTEKELKKYHDAVERGKDVGEPAGVPYDRAGQEARLAKAERDLARLGKVNPLALEEYAALQERYAFLSTQVEDIQQARKDLLEVVEEVDERIQTVFQDAFEDVSREFVGVFSTLFPGGEGRLYLTDPTDMLNTGVELEARPPGKKVKRLSLLSGGEKSLTAIAMLVAIFKARPSPFYILDEVEAALDDTNLHRLLGLFRELKEQSQLLIITHQKLTMDLADVLYGFTMKGDGVTRVISQRMHAPVPLGGAEP